MGPSVKTTRSRATTESEGSDGPSAGQLSLNDTNQLYMTYRPQLERFARAQGASDPEGIADLALLDGLRALPNLAPRTETSFRSYIFKAARSRAISEARKRQPEHPAPLSVFDQLPSEDQDPAQAVIDSLFVEELLALLTDDQRRALHHRYLLGHSTTETAEYLGKSPGAIRKLQHDAIRRLRRKAAIVTAALLIVAAIAVALLARAESQHRLEFEPVTRNTPTDPNPSDEQPSETLILTPADHSSSSPGVTTGQRHSSSTSPTSRPWTSSTNRASTTQSTTQSTTTTRRQTTTTNTSSTASIEPPPPPAPPQPTPVPIVWALGPGQATSSPVLPLGGAVTSGALPNYDTDRDDAAGLLIQKGGGPGETDPTKVQRWWRELPAGADLTDQPELRLWAAMKDFDLDKTGRLDARLYDCADPRTGCEEMASGSASVRQANFGADFGLVTVTMPTIDRPIAEGRGILVELTVPPSSQDDLWLAFGTQARNSRLVFT